ncbi:putative PEP-binding protein [Leptolyngbya ohadii]|uniref:putative PEP-binding protein n=1 Tax=Leptolyngbya ohadii TaxID=1962290 RepID=UPI000B5A0A9B|nr:putative PEP-binding protein [Leptolyngbya ohadii]
MSVDYFFWLDQIQPHDRDRVGSKAFYLSLLQQRGYPVVPGLVVSSDLFQTFLGQIQWADPTFADLPASSLYIDVDNPRQLRVAAQHIRQAIVSTPLPDSWLLPIKLAIEEWQTNWQTNWQSEAVILRPSFSLVAGIDPTLSSRTRGLLDAHICHAEPETIGQTLKQVWAELFRARSLLYWQRLGIQPQQVQLAVLIQPISSAIAAGEASMGAAELEVQAVYGLGHGMTQGVIPDLYRIEASGTVQVDRVSRKTVAYEIAIAPTVQPPDPVVSPVPSEPFISEPNHGLQMQFLQWEQQTQSVLTQAQVERLAHLCRQLMLTLDMAVDLEWMLWSSADSAEPVFYVTQVIPFGKRSSKSSLPSSSADLPAARLPETGIPCPSESTAEDCLKGIAAAPGKAIAPVWIMPQTATSLQEMPSGCVLVARFILPEWVSQLRRVAGIVTEQGGATSHGAILARELGIPAVVGIADVMQEFQTGENVLVNGDRGEVVRMVADPESSASRHFEHEHSDDPLMPSSDSASPQTSQDNCHRSMPPTATRLMVSLSQTESIAQLRNLQVDGIGLLRSELLWLQSFDYRSPQEWLQQDRAGLVDRLAQQIQQFAAGVTPRPVFYRSLDFRAHEFPLLAASEPSEAHPMLGVRGAYRYQIYPDWFEVELAALKQVQQASYDNLRLILPFVRTVEEFIFCRDRIEQMGLRQPTFELWMMAEVPSVLLLLPDYIAAGAQGFAIGCNDLTQLLLGVDRDHPQMAARFNMTHPAVMRAIEQIIQTCRTANLPCTLCGQLPRQMEVIDQLVEWGVTGISVDPGDVTWMGEAIDRAERRLLLEWNRE